MIVEKYDSQGTQLAYRWLPATDAVMTLVCFHGSSLDSRRYLTLARVLNLQGINVCLPDWRGHGESSGTPGDIDHPEQLEEDVDVLVNHLSEKVSHPIALGGHSAGSLICLRYLKRFGSQKIAGFFAIAPPLTESHETNRYDWAKNDFLYRIRYARKRPYHRVMPDNAKKYLPKLNLSKYFLARMFPFMRHSKVLEFPAITALPGSDAMSYSYMMLSGYSVKNYPELFSAIDIPCSILVGENDEVIDHKVLETLFKWYLSPSLKKSLVVLPKSNHMSVISASATELTRWCSEINTLSTKQEMVA
ncbi:alpha/beta hydrolase [Pleionea sp. CnH1-48]|uniref:alpha/beta hydrolase n=1 Tax=Pleionea sp. CnH1-48 TaxID=2954494 RepID=UPI002096A44D|nr:alpha/beta hydrolase [Pleionea sp. CnH1-48]MCO7225535.1 alpha/beta hydrolase [Pleionea sp. CnH1-48]